VPYNAANQSNNAGAITTIQVSLAATVTISNLQATVGQLSFTFDDLTKFSYVTISSIANGITIGTPIQYSPNGVSTYTDVNSNYIGGINYSYQITPYNSLGQAGTPITTATVSPPLNMTTSLASRTIISNTSMVIYYPFDVMSSPYYTPKYSNVIDASGMYLYYSFDM
jgi:hypothetical protein